jgi:hypothetical protein
MMMTTTSERAALLLLPRCARGAEGRMDGRRSEEE